MAELVVECTHLIGSYLDQEDPEHVKIRNKEILLKCVEFFQNDMTGLVVGHTYTPETWNTDIWYIKRKLVTHHIKDLDVKSEKIIAALEFFDENFKVPENYKAYAKICHSQYFTKILKVDIVTENGKS